MKGIKHAIAGAGCLVGGGVLLIPIMIPYSSSIFWEKLKSNKISEFVEYIGPVPVAMIVISLLLIIFGIKLLIQAVVIDN